MPTDRRLPNGRGPHHGGRHVIHAVGPVWQGGGQNEDALLASAYRASLTLARTHRIASIAFPAISTGIYGFPLERATRIAVAAVSGELEAHALPERVVFACFGKDVAAAYRKALGGSG